MAHAEPMPLPGQLTITDKEYRELRALVHEHTGIALGDSKRQMVCARLGKRLRHHGYATFTEYCRHLTRRDEHGDELTHMINALTTNKTDFFREKHHFDFLRQHLIPRLLASAAVGGPRTLRIWSAGCSSGEEPYSIAITLMDAMPRIFAWDVRILASDIDTEMLERGRGGAYPADQLGTIPHDLRARYFLRGRGEGEGWIRLRPEVRQLVAFRRINLRDPAWPIRAQFDGIFCRNVIIYFDRALQQALVTRFVQLLKPDGYLFLGHSESLLGMTVGLTYRGGTVYQKAAVACAGAGELRG